MISSKISASAALSLALNLLFALLVTASYKPTPNPRPNYTQSSCSHSGSGSGSRATCPRDALKLGVCADIVKLVNVIAGSPPTLPCCSLLQGLVDLEVAVCLRTAIKAKVLGINLNVPASLSLLLNACGRKVPTGFKCS
ncbi:hypothetical protein AAC387_Pa01g3217 [Persea americana]